LQAQNKSPSISQGEEMEKIIFCDRNYLSIAFNIIKLPGFFQAVFYAKPVCYNSAFIVAFHFILQALNKEQW
jgi:hypothetical protein